ncbi:MAG: hypothetical protein VX158_02960, partial [Pseudomonadota bacterium]|nr:hypothetical protein [Pseudomonadota bacterium]
MLPRPSRLDATFQYRHHGLKERNYQANDMQNADGQLTVFAGYEWRCWLGMLQGPMVLSGYDLSACVIRGSLTVGPGCGRRTYCSMNC